MSSRSIVERLLAEDVSSVIERERSIFDELAGAARESIVFSGAGGLGRRCLAGLRRQGLDAIAFTDNNPDLWGSSVDGLTVFSPEEAARKFGESAVFVVTIWGAHSSDRMNDRQAKLQSLGCRRVVPFGPLFWKYPQGVLPHYAADLPHRVIGDAENVLRAFDLWTDDRSRREYVAQLNWRLTGDFDALPPPEQGDIYFSPDFIRLRPDEVYVDCGAFDGDTIEMFLKASQSSFEQIFAFEPDPANFKNLSRFVRTLPDPLQRRIALRQSATGAENGTAHFSAQGSLSSHIGVGDHEVNVVTLDTQLTGYKPTFIKMDIEGAEPDALSGGRALIQQSSPILAISNYHVQDHLWAIPLLIHSMNPDYSFYLRPHDLEGWDLVCYAVPHSRSRQEQ